MTYEEQAYLIDTLDAKVAELEAQQAALVAALKQVKMDIEFESLGLQNLKSQINRALAAVAGESAT